MTASPVTQCGAACRPHAHLLTALLFRHHTSMSRSAQALLHLRQLCKGCCHQALSSALEPCICIQARAPARAGQQYSLTYSARHSSGGTSRSLVGLAALEAAWHMASGRILLCREDAAPGGMAGTQQAARCAAGCCSKGCGLQTFATCHSSMQRGLGWACIDC